MSMTPFLQKLRKKDIVPPPTSTLPQTKTDDGKPPTVVNKQETPPAVPSPVAQKKPPAPAQNAAISQLAVDVYRTNSAIIIHAQVAGAGTNDFSVMIEGDDDVVTIKGNRAKPNGDVFPHDEGAAPEQILSECSWGQFYRQIILPAAVDIEKAEAKVRDGVLYLRLPLKQHTEKGTRLNIVKV